MEIMRIHDLEVVNETKTNVASPNADEKSFDYCRHNGDYR